MKLSKYIWLVLVIMAVAVATAVAVASDDAFEFNLNAGEALTVNCPTVLSAEAFSPGSWSMICAGFIGETATPVVTPETTPPPTPVGVTPDPTTVPPNPTATPSPNPTATLPPSTGAFYGDFPNGKNGGVCAESHAWWQEDGESAPRHSHSGSCVPAARGAGGNDGPLVSNFNISARALAFNSPGEVNWHRAQWEGNTVQTNSIGQRCQNSVGEFKECTYWETYNLNAPSGMDELRLATDMRHGDLGTRQYSVINFQIRSSSGGNYRGGPWIIGRHWYDGFGYVRVYLYDYMEYVKPGESMPRVSGTFKLKVKHDGIHCTEGQMYLNPQFHTWHANGATVPPADETSSCGSHTYTIDTTKLPNGRNTLYFQTMAVDGRGELASAVLLFIDVNN